MVTQAESANALGRKLSVGALEKEWAYSAGPAWVRVVSKRATSRRAAAATLSAELSQPCADLEFGTGP